MFGHDIIVVGASAGGVEALPRLIAQLPSTLPASIFVVLHTAPYGQSQLAQIIRRTAALTVSKGIDGQRFRKRHVYVAPPDYHLQIDGTRMRLSRGPRENFHRPAIDVLFRSAAECYRERVVGVVLTGYLDDGTWGLHDVKKHGGVAIVQDPKDAVAPEMPQSAARNVEVDYCLPLIEIAPLLHRLATTFDISEKKNRVRRMKAPPQSPAGMEKQFGPPTSLVCPECDGPLWELKNGGPLQFRCHVGHALSPATLLAGQTEGVERALWSAVRSLDEQASLLSRLTARGTRIESLEKSWKAKAREHEKNANIIRKLLRRR